MRFYNYKSKWSGIFENMAWESDLSIFRDRPARQQSLELTEECIEKQELIESQFLSRIGHWQYEMPDSLYCLCVYKPLQVSPSRGVIARISVSRDVKYMVESSILWGGPNITADMSKSWKTASSVSQAVEEIEKELREQLAKKKADLGVLISI